MVQVADFDLKQAVLANSAFGPQEIKKLISALSTVVANYRLLREAVQELEIKPDPTPASNVRLGVCFYLMGRYRNAIEILSSADGGAVARFYLGNDYFARENYQ